MTIEQRLMEPNRYKIGIFVFIGVCMIFAGFFLLGLREIFQPKIMMTTIFGESVQGLEIGNSVKFKGVPIGKVKNITIREKDKLIRVDMEVLLSTIEPSDEKSKEKLRNPVSFRNFIENEVKNGLRCQLQHAGITGMKYVEIDYFDLDEPPSVQVNVSNIKQLYIPSKNSLLSGIQTSIVDVLARMRLALENFSKIDFDKFNSITDEFSKTMATTNKLLKDKSPKVDELIASMKDTSDEMKSSVESFHKVINKDIIRKITDELSTGINSMTKLAQETRDEIKESGFAELVKSTKKQISDMNIKVRTKELSEALQKGSSAANAVTEIQKDLKNSITKLNSTLDSLSELIKYLDEDPSSLIMGKKKQPIPMEQRR